MFKLVLLTVITTLSHAAPSHYLVAHTTPAVQAAVRSSFAGTILTNSNRRDLKADNAVDCGTPNPSDAMWFTQNGCSISSVDNYTYLDGNTVRTAKKGDLIKQTCDDVFCPTPTVPDCYGLDNVCSEKQFCWINQHEKWGQWAMGQNGTTRSSDCTDKALQEVKNTNDPTLLASYTNYTCNSGIEFTTSFSNAWKPVHGQCVTYRQESQSCISDTLAYQNRLLDSPFPRQQNGKTFLRPLVCDPTGGKNGNALICTGPEFEVLPSTCVQSRPQDTCFSGPWWYSLDCPRTSPKAPKSGLNREQVLNIASTMMLLFVGEVGWPATCVYWDNSTQLGKATATARTRMYAILAALWPADENLVGPPPTFDEIMAGVPNQSIIRDINACYANENNAESEQVKELQELNKMAVQPNKIWSGAHFLMHNQPLLMTAARVAGSKALASFLLDYFWCDDCRGFFYEGVVATYGMPPDSLDPEAHAKWWWWGHNVASEHVATSRGGHPWIHQLGAPDVVKYQHPFFMAWEDAVKQWRVEV